MHITYNSRNGAYEFIEKSDIRSDIKDEQVYEPKYYRDGIVYRPSVQYTYVQRKRMYFTIQLGKLEEIEKNKSFQ